MSTFISTAKELRAIGQSYIDMAVTLEGLNPNHRNGSAAPAAKTTSRMKSAAHGTHYRKQKKETCGDKLPDGTTCKKKIAPSGRRTHHEMHLRLLSAAKGKRK